MQKFFLIIGTILGGLSVALGAFGAHGLKKLVPAETVATYQTGVQYQMYHALALLVLGVLADRYMSNFVSYAGWFFLAGIVLFSGSLYLIVSMHAMNKDIPTSINLITPLGGLLFIAGWILLLIAFIRK
jgi:uncharacterized membrane protein YgdD (TMEM256/DUF423 family)